MSTVSELALSLVGKKVTVKTNPYGGQCVSLIDYIVQIMTNGTKNLSYTNAKDCLRKAKEQGLEVIYNDFNNPNLIPQPNDFFVMDWGDAYGHIGVVISADKNGMSTVEQNIDGYRDDNGNGLNDQLEVGGGGYTRKNYRSYANVIGWFRIPQQNTKPQTNSKAVFVKNETGTMTVSIDKLNVRDKAGLDGRVVATYEKGQQFKYDSVYDADGYRWVSYVSYSGARRYVAYRKIGGEKYGTVA